MARQLTAILETHLGLWQALRKKFVIATASRSATGAFYREGDLLAQARCLRENGVTPKVLAQLCAQLGKSRPAQPCVIDVSQAASLVMRQKLAPADALQRALVRYQGTDGVRGRVAQSRLTENPLKALVERGEFTPGLCELLCAAFALQQKARTTDAVVLAEDGRDTKRVMARVAISGFRRFGVRVLDLGIAPTPLVPVVAAEFKAKFGAAITASHNPADQNGIKFFVNGRKLLPDPDDLALSAFAFVLALEGLPAAKKASVKKVEAEGLLLQALKAGVSGDELHALRRATFVVDTAHGAFSPYAREALNALGICAQVINDDMTGANINRDSGVACLEGKERIAGKDAASEVAIVGRLRSTAQAGDDPTFGIALDGDGDRGFVLVYEHGRDEVRIIDGDRAACLLAQASGGCKGKVFAGTVESDLAVFRAVEKLGIKTVMTPVGDKWLSSVPELARRLFVGEESSGHLVWPIKIAGRSVITGNGLLTGLCVAAAILKSQRTMPEAAEPYEPGVVKTFYTYYVDRPRFHRGGPVWERDLEIARAGLVRLKRQKLLPSGARLRPVFFKDDPDMLYLKIQEKRRLLGAVFARNSGTENKIATYARGLVAYETALVALARAINRNHVRSMRDERLPEARAGQVLVNALSRSREISMSHAGRLCAQCGVNGETRFSALLFALAKEGSARRAGDRIRVVV